MLFFVQAISGSNTEFSIDGKVFYTRPESMLGKHPCREGLVSLQPVPLL